MNNQLTPREAFAAMMARINWQMVLVFAVAALVLGSVIFASIKLYAVWQQYPGVAFLPFVDMHYPLMLFSALFTLFYIQHRDTESVAFIALFSTVLNALLV